MFQRAILQSGSALSPWALVLDPLPFTRQLATALNCSRHVGGPSPPLLHCLKQLPVQDLVSAPVRRPPRLSAFGPTVDGRTLPGRDVRQLMARPSGEALFANVSLLAGFSRYEGWAGLTADEVEGGVTGDVMRRSVRTLVHVTNRYHRQTVYDILVHQYRDWDGAPQAAHGRSSLACPTQPFC